MNSLFADYEKQLHQRASNHSLRKLTLPKAIFDFCSNDYLGLARNPELATLIEQELASISTLKIGSTGSRLISGNHEYTLQTEEYIAQTHHTEAALLFNSGYNANLAVLSTLPQRNDTVFYDELSHACIKDGIRLSLASRFPFKHNDINELDKKLSNTIGRKFVVVESIYSMDGDEAPLKELASISLKHEAILIVDEAHSTGNMGKNGAGLVCALGLEHDIPIRIHTYGKAMGCHGASVVANKIIINYLINFARPFIYTTAMPLHGVVTINCAYQYLKSNATTLQRILQKNIDLFTKSSQKLPAIISNSPIQAVIIGGNEKTRKTALEIQNQGFDVRPILSPTVKLGSERLRICLHVFNFEEEIEKLINTICKIEYFK